MQTVQCPNCALRFEPVDVVSASRPERVAFCPQCGHEFEATGRSEDVPASLHAAAAESARYSA